MTTPSKAPLIVIGSGIAGLLAARLYADSAPVVVLTKAEVKDCSTEHSQGGITAVWAETDSVRSHVQDTLDAGKGLCDLAAVQVLSESSKAAILKLIELGVNFDKDEEGEYLLGLEGAHSQPRILHAGGDATGREIERALLEAVANHPNIELYPHCPVIRILRHQGRVGGVEYWDGQHLNRILGSQVVLASGGAGQLYQYTSTPESTTGEGIVLAYLAGASLADIEFMQFHPTGLCLPGVKNFLLSEALRGEGAILRNKAGHAFMADLHPLKDLAPRDDVARANFSESMKQGGDPVFLDATSLGAAKLEHRFPTILNFLLNHGLDIRKEPIPVTPVGHYLMGGVACDLWGRTNLPGLYVSGEAARTGVHGANRLASNSLLEGVVFSIRIAQALLEDQEYIPEIWEMHLVEPGPSVGLVDKTPWDKKAFQKIMWEGAGIVRSQASLQGVEQALAGLELVEGAKSAPQDFELAGMKLLGKLLVQSALERKESRGSHYRTDYPLTDPAQNHPIFRNLYQA